MYIPRPLCGRWQVRYFQSMEAKRIVSENASVFTFLKRQLDQEWSNAATKSYVAGRFH